MNAGLHFDDARLASRRWLTPASSSEVLMYAVKRLETYGDSGDSWIGTGYACAIPERDGREIAMFVTNRHVVDKACRFDIHFHTSTPSPEGNRNPDGRGAILSLDSTNSKIICHPDKDIDLAAILIGPALAQWRSKTEGERLFTTFIKPDDFWPDANLQNLDTCEPILMIGCPNDIWDSVNKFPLFRRGHTATHPAIDYEGRPEFVADIAVFSGSSGSPVFLWGFDQNFSKPSGGFAGTIKYGLLGTLWGGPHIDEKFELSSEPSATAPILGTASVRMHIGYVIKAREVLRLFDAVRAFVELRPNTR